MELETAGTYLNENFRGWPIERIRAEVARRVEMEREAYRELLTSVEELCRKGALAGGESGATIFVDGIANLIRPSRTASGCGRCCWRWRPSSGWWSC